MTGATAVAVAVTLAVAVFAGPLFEMSERAASDLLDRTSYVGEVMSR